MCKNGQQRYGLKGLECSGEMLVPRVGMGVDGACRQERWCTAGVEGTSLVGCGPCQQQRGTEGAGEVEAGK